MDALTPARNMSNPPDTAVERWDLAPDLSISRVITGLWQIADMERDGKELDLAATAREMEPYVEAGLTTFDMADHYGSAEEIAGLFRQEHGADSAQLFTKWVPKPGPSSRADVRAAVERSLERMRADRLDLLQFHSWNYADPSYLDTLFFLQELKDEGLIRYLGMTNTDTAHLRLIINSGIDIASNQVCFSLLDQRARTNGMTELCDRHGITLLAFGAVAGGFLTERWLDQPEPRWDRLETWSEMKYGRFIREAGGWEALQGVLRAVTGSPSATGSRWPTSPAGTCSISLRWAGSSSARASASAPTSTTTWRCSASNSTIPSRAEITAAVDALAPHPGRLRRRVPPASVSDRHRRPVTPHRQRCPSPYPAVAVGEDGREAGIERHRVGGSRRFQPRRAPRQPHPGIRHHRHPRRLAPSAARMPRISSPLRHRQDRGGAAIARRHACKTWCAPACTSTTSPHAEAVARVHGERFAGITTRQHAGAGGHHGPGDTWWRWRPKPS